MSFSQFATLILAVLATMAAASAVAVVAPVPALASDLQARVRCLYRAYTN